MTIRLGDCLEVFGAEPDASIDAFVSDWPAGVAFMGREWDKAHGGRDAWVRYWAERAAMMRRKAKPGAYSLTWALPRTQHWTATALDDAGWVIQDVITHVFGQGWPKGKAALKPASEHWILARNGSGGALQIDATRVPRGGNEHHRATVKPHDGAGMWGIGKEHGGGFEPSNSPLGSWPANFVLSHCPECEERGTRKVRGANAPGRGSVMPMYTDPNAYGMEDVPAFDCLAACDCGASVLAPAGGEPPRCACGAAMWWACPVAEMDRQSGQTGPGNFPAHGGVNGYGGRKGYDDDEPRTTGDSGGASRFFHRFAYQAKASGGERHAGCERLYWRADKRNPFGFSRVTLAEWEALPADARAQGNVHPTVKSLDLMTHLVSLITPPGGRVGDVTAGSGGTALACDRLGFDFLGAEICPEAIEIAEARRAWWRANTIRRVDLFGNEETILPEAKKEAARPKAAPKPPPPPTVDPRQKALF